MNQNGAHLLGAKPRMPVGFNALVAHLEPDGTFEPDAIQVVQGQAVATTRRDQYLDAEDLLTAIRQIVREELVRVVDELHQVRDGYRALEDFGYHRRM